MACPHLVWDTAKRKSVRDSFGAPRTVEVVAVVKGVARRKEP